jgi:hypothetical protein
MNIQPDFEELLRLLEEHKVEYLIVGGYAVAFHGYPRFTKGIDIFFTLSLPAFLRCARASAFSHLKAQDPKCAFKNSRSSSG